MNKIATPKRLLMITLILIAAAVLLVDTFMAMGSLDSLKPTDPPHASVERSGM